MLSYRHDGQKEVIMVAVKVYRCGPHIFRNKEERNRHAAEHGQREYGNYVYCTVDTKYIGKTLFYYYK